MKKSFIAILLLLSLSCSKDKAPDTDTAYTPVVAVYDGYQLESWIDLNTTRATYGAQAVIPEQKLTALANEQAYYMDRAQELNHDYFWARFIESQAAAMGEICAYNYQSAQAEISAYENSTAHLNIMVNSKYKYCGIAKVGNYQCIILATYEYGKMKVATQVNFIEHKADVNGGTVWGIEAN